MSDDLYFITIIERALKEPDVAAALEKAFTDIQNKGEEELYAEGYRNFKRFMDIAHAYHEAVMDDHVRKLIVELATGTFATKELEKQLLWKLINLCPEWRQEYEAVCHEQAGEQLHQDPYPIIQVSSNDRIIGELHFDNVPGHKSISGIVPGKYVLKLLNTGWTIWHGELTAPELITTSLDFAAGAREGRSTGQKDLLNNGQVILRTCEGIESGNIVIELTR